MWFFLMCWCGLSVVGTVLAAAMIRAGKRQAAMAGIAARATRSTEGEQTDGEGRDNADSVAARERFARECVAAEAQNRKKAR